MTRETDNMADGSNYSPEDGSIPNPDRAYGSLTRDDPEYKTLKEDIVRRTNTNDQVKRATQSQGPESLKNVWDRVYAGEYLNGISSFVNVYPNKANEYRSRWHEIIAKDLSVSLMEPDRFREWCKAQGMSNTQIDDLTVYQDIAAAMYRANQAANPSGGGGKGSPPRVPPGAGVGNSIPEDDSSDERLRPPTHPRGDPDEVGQPTQLGEAGPATPSEARVPVVGASSMGAERPPGLPENIPYIPDRGDRRLWLDQQLENYEQNTRQILGEEMRGELEEVLIYNFRVAEGDPQALEKEKIALIKELRARFWLHNFNAQILSGKFSDSMPYIQMMENILPTLVEDIPGVKEDLVEYEGDDGSGKNVYSIFRQPEEIQTAMVADIKKRRTAEYVERFKAHPEEQLYAGRERTIATTSQRITERILKVLGVASFYGAINFKESPTPGDTQPEHWHEVSRKLDGMTREDKKTYFDSLPREDKIAHFHSLAWEDKKAYVDGLSWEDKKDHFNGLDWEDKKAYVDILPWEERLKYIDLESSFNDNLPFAMTKLMHYGYRLEWDAKFDKPTDTSLPKPIPEMKRYMLFPLSLVNNFLGRAGINKGTVVKETDKNGKETEKKISGVEILANRMSNMNTGPQNLETEYVVYKPNAPAGLHNLPWNERAKWIDVAQTDERIRAFGRENSMGPPAFLWLLRLEALNAMTGEIEKGLMVHPSNAACLDILGKHLNNFSRGDKETLSKMILERTGEYEIAHRSKYEKGESMVSPEAEVALFEAAHAQGNLSKAGLEELKNKYLGSKWRRVRLAFFRAFDLAGALWEMIKAIFKAVTSGLGK